MMMQRTFLIFIYAELVLLATSHERKIMITNFARRLSY
jgi:hypothetical protein